MTVLPLTKAAAAFAPRPGLRGLTALERPVEGLHPASDAVARPLLTLNLATYERNKAVMFDICRTVGCQIAPHAKTPMSPVLAQDMVTSGAWGASVADLRQAEVMLVHGVPRLLIANEIGGPAAAKRLAHLARTFPKAELWIFVDSVPLLSALAAAWTDGLPPLNLLVEVGCGRGGIPDRAGVDELLAAYDPASNLRLAGVAAYEGTVNRPDAAETQAGLAELFPRVAAALTAVRRRVGAGPLILSMGGSALFDHVIQGTQAMIQADGDTTLLLRSGASFFSDNGRIAARLMAMAERDLLGQEVSAQIAASFAPALRLWAEVLSVNVPGQAILGLGMRDAGHDQGFPLPLGLWRNGRRIAGLDDTHIRAFNDQHAFLDIGETELLIGDVIELGVRHPCTTIDKHAVLFGVDEAGLIRLPLSTFFG